MSIPAKDSPLDPTSQSNININQTDSGISTMDSGIDTGPIPASWEPELLKRYTAELSNLDSEEESLLHRLQAIQRLQLLWATAGRIGEMDRADHRIKTRNTKVLLEDEKVSKKRRKLESVMDALQDVVARLDEVGPVEGNRR